LSQANSGIIKLPYNRLKLFPSIFTATLPHESTEYADEKGSVINQDMRKTKRYEIG